MRWPRADPDAEASREPGVGVTAAQMGQYQQGLTVRGEPAPARPALQTPGGRGRARWRSVELGGSIRWVDKRVKLRAGGLTLVDNPSPGASLFSNAIPAPTGQLFSQVGNGSRSDEVHRARGGEVLQAVRRLTFGRIRPSSRQDHAPGLSLELARLDSPGEHPFG